MTTIRIIAGTYGFKPKGSSRIIGKDSQSEPFEVENAEAERLIRLGVAEIVSLREAEKPCKDDDESNMSFAQLKARAAELGVDISGIRSKSGVSEAIQNHIQRTVVVSGES